MVRLALGERPTTGFERRESGGFLMLYGRPGVVAGVDDAEVPREWLVERRVAAAPGSRFTPIGLAGGSLATYVVTGADEQQVRERMEFIRAHTTVRYQDDEGAGVTAR
ncbi:hypothetical protein ACFQ2B_32330 [Streptomyces stramineus]